MNEAEQARRPASSRLKTTALLLKGTVARRGAVAYLTILDGEMSWKPLYRREPGRGDGSSCLRSAGARARNPGVPKGRPIGCECSRASTSAPRQPLPEFSQEILSRLMGRGCPARALFLWPPGDEAGQLERSGRQCRGALSVGHASAPPRGRGAERGPRLPGARGLEGGGEGAGFRNTNGMIDTGSPKTRGNEAVFSRRQHVTFQDQRLSSSLSPRPTAGQRPENKEGEMPWAGWV